MKHRSAAELLLIVALLTSLGWTEESWAQAKIARVGILSFDWRLTDDPKAMVRPFRRTLPPGSVEIDFT